MAPLIALYIICDLLIQPLLRLSRGNATIIDIGIFGNALNLFRSFFWSQCFGKCIGKYRNSLNLLLLCDFLEVSLWECLVSRSHLRLELRDSPGAAPDPMHHMHF